MTPLEKCLSVLKALASADDPQGLAIAAAEIDRFASATGSDGYLQMRALETLAFAFVVEAQPTAAAALIRDEIGRRVTAHERARKTNGDHRRAGPPPSR